MSYSRDIILAAHKHCSNHRSEVLSSARCGCFFCLSTFAPTEIHTWIDDEQTAICPKCPVDSVLGDRSGYPVDDPEFLRAMHAYWFVSDAPEAPG